MLLFFMHVCSCKKILSQLIVKKKKLIKIILKLLQISYFPFKLTIIILIHKSKPPLNLFTELTGCGIPLARKIVGVQKRQNNCCDVNRKKTCVPRRRSKNRFPHICVYTPMRTNLSPSLLSLSLFLLVPLILVGRPRAAGSARARGCVQRPGTPRDERRRVVSRPHDANVALGQQDKQQKAPVSVQTARDAVRILLL